SDVALADPVQRDAHSRSSEPKPFRIDLQRFVAHARDGFRDGVRWWAIGGSVGLGEMTGVEIPKRLHRHVKSAAAQGAVATRLGENAHEIKWRVLKHAVAVEPGETAVGPVKAHDMFQTSNLRQAGLDESIRGRRVGVMDLQCRITAERGSGPYSQKRRRAGWRDRPQRQAASGGGNGDEASTRNSHQWSPDPAVRT